MRLIYFTRDYTTHDHRFLSALAETPHQVYYLRLERRGHQLESRSLPPEIEIIPWAGGLSPATLRNGPRLLAGLRRVLRQVKPDLVLAGPLQRSAFLTALASFRPLVSMSWGYDLLHDAQRNAWWRWATRFTLRRSAALVGDCATIRKLAIAYGMPDERIVTFPWGIDLAHFSPAAAPAKAGLAVSTAAGASNDRLPLTMLSTRNWEPIYGVDVIARAFVLAARQRPELRLVMLGNGSQANQVRQIFLKEGLIGSVAVSPGEAVLSTGAVLSTANRVSFPGQIGFDDLPHLYRSADLYLAATHSDGTSISLLEAMACGLPALVSDIPGNREWVNPGENGWLFPDGDAEALANLILAAAEQRECLPSMGVAARRIAEQRADWQRNFPELQRAFDIAMDSTH